MRKRLWKPASRFWPPEIRGEGVFHEVLAYRNGSDPGACRHGRGHRDFEDGRLISGTYLGGSAREVKIEAGDSIQNLNVADIDSIHFGGPQQGARYAAPSNAASAGLLPAGTTESRIR